MLGEDFHPYGFERNRPQIEIFAQQTWKAGITDRLVSPEEFFAEYLES